MGLFDKLFGGKAAKPARPEAVSVAAQAGAVFSPVAGRVEETAQIPDPVFAGEAMGKTVAVWPEEDVVYAPVAGTVTTAMPHAFGIEGADGAEVLVHIGVDTVEMNGDGFTVWAKPGDTVAAGEAMVTVDRAKVAAAGHPDIVMCIITNSDDLSVEVVAASEVAAGDAIMRTA